MSKPIRCYLLRGGKNPRSSLSDPGVDEGHAFSLTEGDSSDLGPVGTALLPQPDEEVRLPVVMAILGDWHNRTVASLPLIAKLELKNSLTVIRRAGFEPMLSLVDLTSRP